MRSRNPKVNVVRRGPNLKMEIKITKEVDWFQKGIPDILEETKKAKLPGLKLGSKKALEKGQADSSSRQS